MLQQTILAVLLLAVCVALIAIGTILGRGDFRIGHACRMKAEGKTARKTVKKH